MQERIRRRTYLTRETARQLVLDCFKLLYNPKRKHMNNGMLPPVGFEDLQQNLKTSGVSETRALR